jgi:3-hydroxyacyl-[acyl-carrier-protein] dehydratase
VLKDSLYTIQNISVADNSIEAIIELNEKHEIFKGHFPGQPVLPGACMMQMIKEILETFFKHKLQLSKADNIRFIAMIDPNENKELKFLIQYDGTETQLINISVKILKKDEIVCCKMKATYKASSAK